jgi:transcriptional regulator with XRE-family HTH domain
VLRKQVIRVAFGQALREQRLARGLTQEHVALEAKMDRKYLSQLENGRFSPSLFMVFRLAEVLGTEPAALVARAQQLLPQAYFSP